MFFDGADLNAILVILFAPAANPSNNRYLSPSTLTVVPLELRYGICNPELNPLAGANVNTSEDKSCNVTPSANLYIIVIITVFSAISPVVEPPSNLNVLVDVSKVAIGCTSHIVPSTKKSSKSVASCISYLGFFLVPTFTSIDGVIFVLSYFKLIAAAFTVVEPFKIKSIKTTLVPV